MHIHSSEPSGEQPGSNNAFGPLRSPSSFEVQRHLVGAAFEVGYSIVSEKGAAIIIMSPRNPYYRDDHNLIQLFSAARGTFGHLQVLNPWEIAHFTRRGLGESDGDARRKARLEGNALRNRLKPILGDLGYSPEHCPEIAWGASVQKHPAYIREYQGLQAMYQARGNFYQDATEATNQVLGAASQTQAATVAVEYLLQELAGLCAAAEIFSVPKIACVYHRRWPVFEKLLAGDYDGRPRETVGFVIIGGTRQA